MCFDADGGLGPPVSKDENESLYLRVTTVKMPTGLPVTIVLSRVEAHVPITETQEYPPRTTICILFPRATASRSFDLPLQRSDFGHTTIGAKWVHALPIKYFSSMPAKADRVAGACYGDDDYECLLPSTITVKNGKERHTTGVSVGFHRYSLGSRMLNVSLPICAPPVRPVDTKSYEEWIKGNAERRDAIGAATNPENAYLADTDALRVLELSSMAFMLMLTSKAIFAPALPDMLHVPLGVPMMVTFATSVAMNPSRFGLVLPTPTDRLACEVFREHVRASWRGLSGETNVDVRAIDVALNKASGSLACNSSRRARPTD